jgi:hypothetical protein
VKTSTVHCNDDDIALQCHIWLHGSRPSGARNSWESVVCIQFSWNCYQCCHLLNIAEIGICVVCTCPEWLKIGLVIQGLSRK